MWRYKTVKFSKKRTRDTRLNFTIPWKTVTAFRCNILHRSDKRAEHAVLLPSPAGCGGCIGCIRATTGLRTRSRLCARAHAHPLAPRNTFACGVYGMALSSRLEPRAVSFARAPRNRAKARSTAGVNSLSGYRHVDSARDQFSSASLPGRPSPVFLTSILRFNASGQIFVSPFRGARRLEQVHPSRNPPPPTF